jgi:uridine kinase
MNIQEQPSSVVIGITGGTGAGKTCLVNAICSTFPKVAVLDQDSYYVDHADLIAEEKDRLNFDHPSAIDHELLFCHLCDLLNGKPVEKPSYCFVSHSRKANAELVEPAPLIIVEGIFALWDPRIRTLTNLKVYVDADADVRFIRRLRRDLLERGRTMESVTGQYLNSVRPMHQAFIDPLKIHADLVIDGTEPIPKALTAICDAITARFQSTEPSIALHNSSPKDGDGPVNVVTAVNPYLDRSNGGRYIDYVWSILDWNLLTASMRRRIRATGAAVFALEDDELVCIARSGKTTPEIGARTTVQGGLWCDFVRDGSAVSTEPKSRIDRLQHCPGARSSVAIPLLQNNTFVGVFEVFSDEKDVFSGSEIKSLGVLAKVIRKSMDNRTMLPKGRSAEQPAQRTHCAPVKNTVQQQNSLGQDKATETSAGPREGCSPSWDDLCRRIIADYEISPEAQSDPVPRVELEVAAENIARADQILSQKDTSN